MNLRQRELVSVCMLFAVVIFYFYLTTQIDLAFSSELEKITGPRAYPRIILGAMTFLGLLLLFQAFLAPKDELEKVQWTKLRSVGLALLLFT